MNAVWLAVLAAAQEPEGGGLGPFKVEFGLVFWTWVVFLVLLFLLWKFAWPTIVQAAEEREKRIRQQLAEAEKAQNEAHAALEEGKRFAAEARSSAQLMLTEARQTAEKERTQLLERARREQEELLDRARREIVAEQDKAMATLRKEAVDLSLAAAAKLVGQRMDSETDRRLVTEYLDSVEIKH
jgi:F-type H+-transporting ATPase subunit b